MLKSGRGLAAFLLVFFAIITLSNVASAGEQNLFDRSLTISSWHVHASQNSFSAADAQKAHIKISKNTPGREIQRGFFMLNGAFTFLRAFLTGDELVFEKDVTLKTANTLFVFLLGEPEAEISLHVIGDDDPAPAPEITSFSAEPLSIKRDESATLTWQTTNADSCKIEPGVGAVDPSGMYSVTPTAATTYTLTADGTGDPATAAVTVTIENTAPVADPQTVSTDEDTAIAIWLTSTDVDGDSLTYAVTVQPGHGSINGIPPNLTYTPHENYNGSDSFSFKAYDGQTDSNTVAVTLNITPVNDVPVANAGQDREVFVGDPVTLDGSGSADVEAVFLNFSWTFIAVPEGSVAMVSDSSAVKPTFTPDLAGTYEVELIVKDAEVDSLADQVVIIASLRMVDVPDVVGMPQADAGAALQADKLVEGAITTDYSETVPEGSVISQNPEAGTSVEENSAVDLTVSLGSASQPPSVSFSASPASIEQGQSSSLSWSSLRAESAHIDRGIGTVAVEGNTVVSPDHTTTYTITVTGPTGSSNARVTVHVIASPEPQPEGSYGEQYEDLVPQDATVDQYDPERFSLITGLVLDINQQLLPGVTITVYSHAEYGSVATDDQGRFSIPVEGGGTLTLVYNKQGLIPAHRKVYVPWNDNAIAETVVMITADPVATTLTFDGNVATIVTHKSEDVVDKSGKRAVTMVFSGDNMAYLVDEQGNDVQELTTITTRATEYQTPQAMPAKLPPNSAFTYCAELSVDGAQRVRFDKPVTTFIDNFLGFPVGSIVPVGYYDRDKGVWVPSENGVVVQLLDTKADGVVDALDADGDGLPDDLDEDGFFSSEIKGLGDNQRYAPGATFWRFQMNHFTPFDCNWPFGPPLGAIASNALGAAVIDQQFLSHNGAGGKSRKDIQCVASFVEQRNRVFHEDIPITGTDMTLHYTSSRVAGYKPGVITVPASGETVPEGLLKIVVQVHVAGKEYEIELPPERNQIAEIEWDGLDYLGRPVKDSLDAHIRIGFVYYGVYFSPNTVGTAFGQAGTNSLTIPTRQEATIWSARNMPIIVGKGSLAEGWTISAHHQMSPFTQSVLLKGDGTISRNNARIIETIAGGSYGFSGDGGPASEAKLNFPHSLATNSAGELFISDLSNCRIRKIDIDGIIDTIAGNGACGGVDIGCDDCPAINTRIRPFGLALDTSGNLYVADRDYHRIRKVDTDGIVTHFAGSGYSGFRGDGGPATEAQLRNPVGVAADAIGNIYIADTFNNRVRKVDPNGIITTVAGTGIRGSGGDRGPAVDAEFEYPFDVDVDSDGNLYIADHLSCRVRKVDTSGIISTVAGRGARDCGYSGDGGAAIDAQLFYVNSIKIDAEGNLYIQDSNLRVRKVDTNGYISTVAGNGIEGYSGDGGPATEAELSPYDVAITANGDLYIADYINNAIRKVSPASASIIAASAADEIVFTELNGIGYAMSSAGLHKRTFDLDTGVSLYEFDYDEENQLRAIIDRFGDTIIKRDAVTGVPTAIISPDGIRTELSIDANNHLKRVTYADGSSYDFEYTSDGLMRVETEPAGNRFEHDFDGKGRLAEVLDGEGGHWFYTREIDVNSEIRTKVRSAEDNITSFLDHTDSTGKYTSTITDPTGALTHFAQSDDGLTENHSLPCGTDLEYIYDLDPEYKYKYAKRMTESTPAELERITTIDRTYTDTNDDDIVDLIVETVTVNDKVTSIQNNTFAAQKTIISPEGKMLTTQYDPATLQVERFSVSGLHPTNYIYDSRGRLTSFSTNTRRSYFTYTADGFLESVTDSKDHRTSYEYDPIGRVTGINRPDGNFIDFSYDANGNMTVLTNPAGTEHKFGYNQVNRNSSYQTPLSGSIRQKYNQ
jgi:YD repeat-containing protein